MNHPLYIAPDEEIISVIARLRTLPDTEVTLVFPKHSVVTQSIINLKLLAREGEKLQKKLTLVSQNENARSLAEKIGFTTLPYTQEMEKGNLYLQGETTVAPPAAPSFTPENNEALKAAALAEEPSTPKPKSAQIGTQSFYQGAPQTMGDMKPVGEPETMRIQTPLSEVAPPAPLSPSATTLRVRNMTPERPPGLNSLRTKEAAAINDISSQSTVSSAIFPDSYHSPVKQSAPVTPQPPAYTNQTPPTAIQNFFNRNAGVENGAAVRMPERQQPLESPAPVAPTFVKKEAVPKKIEKAPVVMVGKSVSNKLTTILTGLVFLLVLATGALGFFLVFPSATVTINPQTINDSYDQSFTVDAATGSDEVPLEKTTQEVTVNIAGIASGAAATPAGAGSKAKGKIKISNNYSSDAQSLVATTRFESTSGKIYRIQETISVPGNGSVEAEVVADGSGESYNMTEGNFTIPGFKGSEKYEKFSASIVNPITGGGGSESSSSGTFIRADEETLRARGAEEAKRVFSESIENTEGDKYVFVEGLQVERVSETGVPKVGTVPGEYQYSAIFKVTAFATSKESVSKAVLKNIRSEYDGITFAPVEQDLSFTDFTLTENNTKASMKAHLETTLAATLSEEKIKADLRGKAASDLENFTTAHPEVKSLSISFTPAWALKRIPSNQNKIELVTEIE